ncbi:hypothetical protein STEG23_028672 [Scotinomys teguina]
MEIINRNFLCFLTYGAVRAESPEHSDPQISTPSSFVDDNTLPSPGLSPLLIATLLSTDPTALTSPTSSVLQASSLDTASNVKENVAILSSASLSFEDGGFPLGHATPRHDLRNHSVTLPTAKGTTFPEIGARHQTSAAAMGAVVLVPGYSCVANTSLQKEDVILQGQGQLWVSSPPKPEDKTVQQIKL